MTRVFCTAALALLCMLALPTTADAQVGFTVGPRLSLDIGDDLEEGSTTFAAGADVRISSVALPFIINPTYDFYFLDDENGADINFSTLNVNALFPFGVSNQVFTPYTGVGLGFSFLAQGPADTVTDAGINIVTGAQFDLLPLKPFVELGYSVYFTDGDQNLNAFGIRGGLLFGL
ncbi:outer membrane beta-barrel protein [Longimonas halophila]|nr:outer membrane beta-barrel protein [Longimonas halophila]